jgi:polyhydroxyalkanoate synthesis repressor PhaR
MPEKVILKKYANRRLYDTEKSAYVTLNEVAELIKTGRQVEVIDAKTKEDVTAFILTQILLEEAKKKNTLLPVALLHLIIRYGENVLEEFFQNYLQITIQNYLKYKSAVDEQFKRWLEVGIDLSDMAQKTMKGLAPFQSFFDQFSPSKGEGEDESRGG